MAVCGNSKHKGPEVGACLGCLWWSVLGQEAVKEGREDEVREGQRARSHTQFILTLAFSLSLSQSLEAWGLLS